MSKTSCEFCHRRGMWLTKVDVYSTSSLKRWKCSFLSKQRNYSAQKVRLLAAVLSSVEYSNLFCKCGQLCTIRLSGFCHLFLLSKNPQRSFSARKFPSLPAVVGSAPVIFCAARPLLRRAGQQWGCVRVSPVDAFFRWRVRTPKRADDHLLRLPIRLCVPQRALFRCSQHLFSVLQYKWDRELVVMSVKNWSACTNARKNGINKINGLTAH